MPKLNSHHSVVTSHGSGGGWDELEEYHICVWWMTGVVSWNFVWACQLVIPTCPLCTGFLGFLTPWYSIPKASIPKGPGRSYMDFSDTALEVTLSLVCLDAGRGNFDPHGSVWKKGQFQIVWKRRRRETSCSSLGKHNLPLSLLILFLHLKKWGQILI